MKTIQEHLREADRKRLLDCLAYRFLSDPIRLLEAREYTVQEIMEGYSRHMNTHPESPLSRLVFSVCQVAFSILMIGGLFGKRKKRKFRTPLIFKGLRAPGKCAEFLRL